LSHCSSTRTKHISPDRTEIELQGKDDDSLIRDDGRDGGVQSRAEHEETEKEEEDVENAEQRVSHPREEVRLVHLIVCDGPEDKAEEGVEGC